MKCSHCGRPYKNEKNWYWYFPSKTGQSLILQHGDRPPRDAILICPESKEPFLSGLIQEQRQSNTT